MTKVLVLCETPYQIIVATKAVTAFYNHADVDIIITNHIQGGEDLAKRLKKSKVFNDAFYLRTKNIQTIPFLNPIINYFNKLLKTQNILEKANYKEKKYDTFLYCNIDIISQHIISFLKKHSNIDVLMFEDGLSSYREEMDHFFKKYYENNNFVDTLKYKVLRSNFKHTKGFYVFNPQYLQWNPKFPVIKIPPITKKESFLIGELNQIFLYDKVKDEYNYKYIFFEESYFTDGYSVNDIELMNKISDIVGKENIIVKIHPRNPVNRFKKLGYKTNKITSIPWEIIALNMQLDDKVLITIASGSVMHPIIIMGMSLKAIMLFNYEGLEAELLDGLIEIIKLICKKNPKYYLLPTNYEELKNQLLLN